MIVGILLFQAVAFAVLSGIVADRKKREPIGWGLIGLLFGLFGFIAALVVEEVEPQEKSTSRREKSQSSSTREFDPDEHEKKCPDCAEYIKLEARVCRYCGHEFSKEAVDQKIAEVKRDLQEERRARVDSPVGSDTSVSTKRTQETSSAAGYAAVLLTVLIVLLLIGGIIDAAL